MEPDLNGDDARTISGDVDDASLLRSIQRGGRGAFAALYDRHASAAFGLAVKITGDRGIAEDVVQDAFLALWKQAPRFDPARGQVKSWLLTIVHHRAVDAVRRRAGRPERALPDGAEEYLAAPGRPEEIAQAAMDAAAVREAVSLIPEDQRKTVEMAYFAGMTHVEIAAATGVPLGTVKSRLRIGLEKMREHLRAKVLE